MAQTLVMRATSLTLAGLAAVSISYTVIRLAPPPDPPPIVSIAPPQPVTPPAPTPHAAQHIEATMAAVDPMPPLAPTGPASSTGPLIADIGPVLITAPHWLQHPRDLARYYPARAVLREMQGVAVLDCLVDTTGQLGCVVVSETPTNWGFGAAALRMAQDYRMVPAMRDGAPMQGRYRMTVPFQLTR
jgi:protein TonB